jgi:hypothetical protein
LESARNILPLDDSPEAQAKRRVASYKKKNDFYGATFSIDL